jgi:hypothetical protein
LKTCSFGTDFSLRRLIRPGKFPTNLTGLEKAIHQVDATNRAWCAFKAASSVRPALYVCAGSFFHFLKEPHFNGSKSLKGGALTS